MVVFVKKKSKSKKRRNLEKRGYKNMLEENEVFGTDIQKTKTNFDIKDE